MSKKQVSVVTRSQIKPTIEKRRRTFKKPFADFITDPAILDRVTGVDNSYTEDGQDIQVSPTIPKKKKKKKRKSRGKRKKSLQETVISLKLKSICFSTIYFVCSRPAQMTMKVVLMLLKYIQKRMQSKSINQFKLKSYQQVKLCQFIHFQKKTVHPS